MPGFSYRAPQERSRFLSSRFFGLREHRSSEQQQEQRQKTIQENEHAVASSDASQEEVAPSTTKQAQDDAHHHHDGPQGWGRGIVQDFRSTVAQHWVSEMTNFNTKTIAVSFFLFIAVIAPSITFGAVYAKRTNNYIGAVELLLATAWCGIFYSLVSGMPMVRTPTHA